MLMQIEAGIASACLAYGLVQASVAPLGAFFLGLALYGTILALHMKD